MRIEEDRRARLVKSLRNSPENVRDTLTHYGADGQLMLLLGDLPDARPSEVRQWISQLEKTTIGRHTPISPSRSPKDRLEKWELLAARKVMQVKPKVSPRQLLQENCELSSGFFFAMLQVLAKKSDVYKRQVLRRLIEELRDPNSAFPGLYELQQHTATTGCLRQRKIDAVREVIRLIPDVHLLSLLIDFGVHPNRAKELLYADIATSTPERQALLEKLSREQAWISAQRSEGQSSELEATASDLDTFPLSLYYIAWVTLVTVGVGFLVSACFPNSPFSVPRLVVEHALHRNHEKITIFMSLILGFGILFPLVVLPWGDTARSIRVTDAWLNGFLGPNFGYLRGVIFLMVATAVALMFFY